MTIYQNYFVKERAEKEVIEHGGVKKAIKHLEKELKEIENLWSKYSSDCLGHGITCTTLKIQYLKENDKTRIQY